jgi:hypothetical protein
MDKYKTSAQKPVNIQIEGYEMIEKTAQHCANSARIILPKDWMEKREKL